MTDQQHQELEQLHPYLLDPEHAQAYQTLCDCPRGTTPAWATKAGWTKARMRTFIDRLQEYGLAEVTRVGNIRIFRAVRRTASQCDTVRHSVSPYLGSGSKSDSDKVPRYAGAKSKKETAPATADELRLIDAVKAGLSNTFPSFDPASLDHAGSIVGARKILAIVPVDRAEQLLLQAATIYNPSLSGGALPYSLGHTFFQRFTIKEWHRIERELEQGQLSMLFLERKKAEQQTPDASADVAADPPPANDLREQLRAHTERRLAAAEEIKQGMDEFKRIGASNNRPTRM